MDGNTQLVYELSQAESTRWQYGGVAALLLQQHLAEAHRQGSLGLARDLAVFHPDGMLAAQYTAHETPQAPALSQVQVPAPVRDLGRAEGTLIETPMITAYQMSARESAAWSRGDHEARMVEANIGDALKDVGTSQPVAVLLDDGRSVYTHGSSLFQDTTAAVSMLRDRLSALASGVHVHMDLNVQLGAPRTTMHASLESLQQRAEALTTTAVGHGRGQQREQGMSY